MDLIKGAFYSIVYVIVGGIFDFVCYVYEIFYALATLNLFDNEIYTDIVNRIYVVLGLIMLFVLAYSLLRAVINPDEFAKGETSFPNMIKNIVISLVIITVLPAIFNVAMNFQNSILMQGSIPKLILAEYDESNIQSGGRDIAYYAYLSIMYPNVSSKICSPDQSVTSCRSKVKGNGWLGTTNGATLSSVDERVKSGELSFTYYQDYSEATRDGNITFQWFLGIIVGIFLLWVIANFCFDMALRVIKLTFYQLIAPIPVVCRIIPGGQFKGVFSTWVKQTVSVYVEVFVRIAILSIGIFLVGIITEYFNGFDTYGSLGTIQTLVLRLLLIIAVVMFMKEAPGLISKMFNMDTGGIKLGLKDKLAAGGVFAAGALAGGGITSMVRNYNATRAAGGGTGKALRSALGGLGSGAARGAKAGFKAKSFGEMRSAAGKAAADAAQARATRAANKVRYKAAGDNWLTGKLGDIGASIEDWATGGVGQYEERIKLGQNMKKSGDAIFDEAEKIMTKNSNNVDMVASMVDADGKSKFKGDPTGDIFKLYNNYAGMSLASIQEDINRQANVVDFSSYVDRNAYFKDVDDGTGKMVRTFDAQGYQNAIDTAARNHAVRVANLRSMYSQLEKESKMKVVDTALNANLSIDGIEDAKLQAIRDKYQEFTTQYGQIGSAIVDPASKTKYGAIDPNNQKKTVAHQVDDIATAFGNVASEASANAARHRQAMEAKKGNK